MERRHEAIVGGIGCADLGTRGCVTTMCLVKGARNVLFLTARVSLVINGVGKKK